ncbi:MAG: PilZ domain-containing protein [Pseudomonadales bacterium]|nr:PilZ domain-containing protein [Pseudomonadales bacterium]
MDQRIASRRWMSQPMPCVGQGEHYFIGQLVNLSETGMMILSDQAVEEEPVDNTLGGVQRFNVLFPSDHGGTGKVQIEADPVWCEATDNENCFRIGFRLKSMTGPKNLMIRHWVKYCTH